MTEAIHSDRKSGSPNGAQGETEGLAAIGAATGMLIISAILRVECRASPSGHLASERAGRPSPHELLTTTDQCRIPKRPLPPPPRSHTINTNADYQNHRRISNLPQKSRA